MAVQTVFQRWELKYMLTREKKECLLERMAPHMRPDAYGRTTIRNLYWDTDSCLLIRRSMEKPVYKEKLRLRSYRRAGPESPVFVELKKKYDHVVYKRRLSLPEKDAMAWLRGEENGPGDSQIAREVDWVLGYYQTLQPKVFLSYEREAYCAKEDPRLRITFDERILARREALTLDSGVYGTALLPEGKVLMEIKCAGGLPLWLVGFLSEERIYKTSFSKYAAAYQALIFPGNTNKENLTHV